VSGIMRPSVWDHYEAVFEEVHGQMIRTKARCKICMRELRARSSDGTGHLLKHVKACEARVANDANAAD
jgi:hypothetical protein